VDCRAARQQFWYLASTLFWIDHYLEAPEVPPPPPFGLEEMDPAALPPRVY
jgi:hypothetical protein